MAHDRLSAAPLHVVRDGAGPPLVLLHGFTGDARELLEAARPLARSRSLIAIDLPGHGRSHWGADQEQYAFDAVVAALDAKLNELGLTQLELWGYSLGGRLALALTLRNPARVVRLVLESTSAGLRPEEPAEQRWLRDRELARLLLEQGLAAFVERWEAEPLFASERELPGAARRQIRATRLSHRANELAAALLGMSPARQVPLWDRLRELTVPTLLVTGARDGKYEAIARELETGLPNSRHISILGAGHAPHRERPEATSAAVRAFLLEGASR